MIPGATDQIFLRTLLTALLRYWNIVRYKTYANLKRDIDKTYLGTIWWVLEPLLNTAVSYAVLSHVMTNRPTNFIPFLVIGNVVYGHFSASINSGAGAMIGNAGLMQQVQLPKSLYPIIAICNLTWKFLFSLLIIFPLLWFLHCPIHLSYLILPVLLAYQIFMVVALSLPLAILMPYFQDGKTLLSTFLVTGVWISGVYFPVEKVPTAYLPYFFLNPAAGLIEGYHRVLMEGKWPIAAHFPIAILICLFSFGIGLWLVAKLGGKITKLPL